MVGARPSWRWVAIAGRLRSKGLTGGMAPNLDEIFKT